MNNENEEEAKKDESLQMQFKNKKEYLKRLEVDQVDLTNETDSEVKIDVQYN